MTPLQVVSLVALQATVMVKPMGQMLQAVTIMVCTTGAMQGCIMLEVIVVC